MPIAEHELRLDASLTSLDAWAKALARAQKSAETRRSYATDVLRNILQFFAIAAGSTSGIERNFSAAKRNLGQCWNGSPLAKERRMVPALAHGALPAKERDDSIAATRQILAESVLQHATGQ